MERFWGVPLLIWMIVCVTIAVLYFIFYPKEGKNMKRSVVERIILKLGHSAVWVLLAIACLLGNFKFNLGAKLVSLLSLLVYLVFLFTLIRIKLKVKAQSHE